MTEVYRNALAGEVRSLGYEIENRRDLPEGGVLDPDNLYKRYFLPTIEKAGLRRFRPHDLRHTFGSLLIQDGASLKYVCEQMGHWSIQVTADTYGHLVPGADISWVDRQDRETSPQQNATPAQPTAEKRVVNNFSHLEVAEIIEENGAPWVTRTPDLLIRSRTQGSCSSLSN